MSKVEVREKIIQEMRRGIVVLAVLSQLDSEQYGYALIKRLADRGLDIDQGTLYPLLRRLESQGLLQSDWRVEEARPRRYYVISEEGKTILPLLRDEWNRLSNVLSGLLN